MKFSEYCNIMQTRGIDELFFIYNHREYCIEMNAGNFFEYVAGAPLKLEYCVEFEYDTFDSFDGLLKAEIFDGNTLEEIWSEIEFITFENKYEENFLADLDSSTFAERMERRKQAYLEEHGVEQWSHSLTDRQSFWYRFQFVVIGLLVIPVVFQLFPILGLANWYFELLMLAVVLISLPICAAAMVNSRVVIRYVVTDKRIKTFNGIECQTAYDNIRKVTMRKYRSKKGYGRIKIYVKKGLSLNFRMVHVPDVENVYNLITENLNNTRCNQDDSASKS